MSYIDILFLWNFYFVKMAITMHKNYLTAAIGNYIFSGIVSRMYKYLIFCCLRSLFEKLFTSQSMAYPN